jgi:hypothetical protein
MPVTLPSFTQNCKALLIEGLSVASAFLTDYLLTPTASETPEEESFRLALDLRVYYLTKNIFYLLDSLFINKDRNFRHLFSGAFNLGVAATLYPSTQLFSNYTTQYTDMLGTQSMMYTASISLRMLFETTIDHQNVCQHIKANAAKLFGGTLGIFFSLIPSAGMSSPALYWTGELYDVYRIKEDNEDLLSIIGSLRSVVPIQAFTAQLVKMSFRNANVTLPFPEFAIDCMVASSHILILKSLNGCNSFQTQPTTQPQAPVTPHEVTIIEMPTP